MKHSLKILLNFALALLPMFFVTVGHAQSAPHIRDLGQGKTELYVRVGSQVHGSNVIKVWDMFALAQSYRGAQVDRVVLRARKTGDRYYNASASLVLNYQNTSQTRDISANSTDAHFVLNSQYVSENLFSLDLNVDGSMYIEGIWVYLTSASHCQPQPCNPSPLPPQPCPPVDDFNNCKPEPIRSPLLYFRGEFGNQRFYFEANNASQIFDTCTQELRKNWVKASRYIEVMDAGYQRNVEYSVSEFCAIAVLNSKHINYNKAKVVLSAVIETDIPIRIEESPHSYNNANSLLSGYLGYLSAGKSIDEITIWGSKHYNRRSYWNTYEIHNMLERRIRR